MHNTIEIGGYMSSEKYYGEHFHNNSLKLNSGNSCLEFIINNENIKKIFLPYYLCESVSGRCKRCDCEIEYYHINEDFSPILNFEDSNGWLYFVNYFGFFNNDYILNLKKEYSNLIVDNVHSFYQESIEGVYTIYSCRKYFGVADGAYLMGSAANDLNLVYDKSSSRSIYLDGRIDYGAKEYYYKFQENEKYLNKSPMMKMSKSTENLLKSIDYQKVMEKRNENFKYLDMNLKDINNLKIHSINGPYVYPLLIKNGEKLRKKLISENIFIPTFWDYVFNLCDKDSIEYNYASNLLPLPIDQRYEEKHMEIIVRTIKEL